MTCKVAIGRLDVHRSSSRSCRAEKVAGQEPGFGIIKEHQGARMVRAKRPASYVSAELFMLATGIYLGAPLFPGVVSVPKPFIGPDSWPGAPNPVS